MRTVSFSDTKVRKALADDFVCCYTNTEGDPSAGGSIKHDPDDTPGTCGKTAGRQNVQTFFLTPDNEIIHVAGGFHSPKDLLEEIKFANGIYKQIKNKQQGRKELVANAHEKHLRKLGFKTDQISGNDSFENRKAERFSPEDLGLDLDFGKFTRNFGGRGKVGRRIPGMDMFTNVSKSRALKDHQYLIKNPLISRSEFEKNPRELTGFGKSFFASNSNMSQAIEQQNKVMKDIKKGFSR